MAKRPVFVPVTDPGVNALWQERQLEFQWHPGFSISQKMKNILALHEAARVEGIYPLLEISTKSESPLGKMLSAFNLLLELEDGHRVPVEAAYQGSKVFKEGGPYREFYSLPGRQIKRDERLRTSGQLIGFDFDGDKWPLQPTTAFYDWLYIRALHQNPTLSLKLADFQGFTDIEFNPNKSINCQARAAAVYVSLLKRNLIDMAVSEKDAFIGLLQKGRQLKLLDFS
jgi:hypothetical protein